MFTRPNTSLKQLHSSFRHVVIAVVAILVFFFLYLTIGTGDRIRFQWVGLPKLIKGEHKSVNSDYEGYKYGNLSKTQLTPPEAWARRAEKVKEAFIHAYSGYEQYAFPHDELLTLSQNPKDNFNGWGVTVFDSLDTMLLMGLTEQFERAMAFVSQSDFTIQRLDFKAQSAKLHMNREVSFFETAIRYLGGLLSAYALSNEAVFLQKADELASILAPAFDTGSGFPRFGFDILTGLPVDRGISGSLAEVASCQLEYAYLARLTGKKEHYDRSAKIFDNLRQVNLSETGMLPKSYGLMNGEPLDRSISVGGGSDSGHEYLLKYYLLTGQKDDWSLDMYMRTINHVMTKMLYVTPRRGLLYITDIYGFRDTPAYRMEHLSCFFPGLLALGVHTLPPDVFSNAHKGFTPSQAEKLSGHDVRDLHMWAAIGLGETCWRMYADEASGLSPELIAMRFPTAPVPSGLWVDAFTDWKVNGTGSLPPGTEDKPLMDNVRDYEVSNRNYYLRPETVESMYLLWKATGDELWRDRGWVIFEALEKEARTEVAYAPLKNVAVTDGGQHDDMPSFFLAETLKYLYLLFLDEDPVPLDKWVYNTEAHPFPIFEWSSLEKSNFNISES